MFDSGFNVIYASVWVRGWFFDPLCLTKRSGGHAHKESDPMCRRTPPEAKTAQVVDATLCARVIVGKR